MTNIKISDKNIVPPDGAQAPGGHRSPFLTCLEADLEN